MLISAEYQSKGRGQKNNVWNSETGANALFSIYLRPDFLQPNQLNALSFIIALGVRAAIQQMTPKQEVRLKWPNDILVGDRKIAGILIENNLGEVVRSVVGIGVNVNQVRFPASLKAVSLSQITGANIDITFVIHLCCEFIEKYYLLAKQSSGLQQIHNLYVSQMYKLDEAVMVDGMDWIVKGVDATGKLELERAGRKKKIVHNEAQIIWN